MHLELKSISHNEALSEETNAYSATLYLDGKKVAAVSNHGQGGCDEQHWFDRAAEAKITAYFAAMPERATKYEIDGKPFMVQPDLEGWCGDQLTAWLINRDYKRILSRKVVTTDGVTEWTWKIKPADLGNAYKGGTLRDYVLAQRVGTRIVNDFSATELADHIKAMMTEQKKAAA